MADNCAACNAQLLPLDVVWCRSCRLQYEIEAVERSMVHYAELANAAGTNEIWREYCEQVSNDCSVELERLIKSAS